MHQMRGRMIPRGTGARLTVDLGRNDVSDSELAALELAVMTEDVGLDLLGIVDREQGEAGSAFRELTAIADLAARLRIERRAVEHDDAALCHRERVDGTPVAIQRNDARFFGQRVVAVENGLRTAVSETLGHLEGRGSACALALLFHRRVESRLIDGD